MIRSTEPPHVPGWCGCWAEGHWSARVSQHDPTTGLGGELSVQQASWRHSRKLGGTVPVGTPLEVAARPRQTTLQGHQPPASASDADEGH